MALYRAIQITFWTDAKVSDNFTPEDKYFYLYLLTNPHTNLCGCYEISIRQMAIETGYSKETIERLLLRFRNVHKIIDYSTETNEILLLNWAKNNWTRSEKYLAGVKKFIPKIKSPNFRAFLGDLVEDIDTVYIGYLYPTDTANTITNTITTTNSINNIERDNTNSLKKVKKPKIEKMTFGEYHNVRLTEDEYKKLQNEFMDWAQRIEDLSSYIASKGDKYKSHYATIRSWAARDEKEGKKVPRRNRSEQTGRETDENGIIIYNFEHPDTEEPPYYGLPPEWFDSENQLIKDRVTAIHQPKCIDRGIYNSVVRDRDFVLELYEYRRAYFERQNNTGGS